MEEITKSYREKLQKQKKVIEISESDSDNDAVERETIIKSAVFQPLETNPN
jgi:hypothetical protein